MKHFLLFAVIVSFCFETVGQNDTLLFYSFDNPVLPSYFSETEDTSLTGSWLNYSLDSIPAANNRPNNWYLEPGFANVDSNNQVLASSSWLDLFQPGNKNYLISPGFYLPDASAELSWYSASWHTPVYLDGYIVLLSTTDNRRSSFTDTLFRAAQYLGILSEPDSTSPVPIFNNYRFSEGFIHGYDGTYIEFDGDSTDFKGVLRPHSVSLAQYGGDTVYIAFLHDSDDDNLISLDNPLLKGTQVIGLNESELNSLVLFPNPARTEVNVRFHCKALGIARYQILDIKGKVIESGELGTYMPGNHTIKIPLLINATGNYILNFHIGSEFYTQSLVVA